MQQRVQQSAPSPRWKCTVCDCTRKNYRGDCGNMGCPTRAREMVEMDREFRKIPSERIIIDRENGEIYLR
jgi:hypothetical protein